MSNELVIRSGIIDLGEITTSIKQVSATYIIGDDDYSIEATSNSFNITLPSASSYKGREYTIKNSGSGSITIIPTNNQKIDGKNSIILLQYESLYVQSNGTNWI